MNLLELAEASLVLAKEEKDSGIACLLSVIRFHGGDYSQEHLRIMTGAGPGESTLLGLTQAARKTGLTAKGYKLDAVLLQERTTPCILNIIQKQVLRYVIHYGTINIHNETKFVIGDPAAGILCMSQKELEGLWTTNICLSLDPASDFTKIARLPKKESLYHFLLQEKPLLWVNLVLAFLLALMAVCPILYCLKVADVWLPAHDFTAVMGATVALLCVAVVYEVLYNFQYRIAMMHSLATIKRINNDLFENIARLPKLFFDAVQKDSLNFKYNDTQAANAVLNLARSEGIKSMAITIVLFTALAILSPKAFLFTLPFLFLYAFLLKRDTIKSREEKSKIKESITASGVFFNAFMRNIDTVRESNQKRLFTDMFKQHVLAFQYRVFELDKKKAVNYSVAKGLFVILFSFAFLFHVYLLMNQKITIGTFVAVIVTYAALGKALSSFFPISTQLDVIFGMLNQAREISFIQEKENGPSSEIEYVNALAVADLEFSFPGQNKTIFKNVSFSVSKGETIGIVGANNSGKSTIAKVLLKHFNYEKGNALINDSIGLNTISTDAWHKVVAHVPQVPVVLNGTLLDHIGFDDTVNHKTKLQDFIAEFQLEPFIQLLPQRELTFIGEGGLDLSLAHKQIISLLRAVYKEPHVLVLDEPMAFLPGPLQQYFFFVLNKVKEKTSIVLLTTNTALAEHYCTRVYRI